MPRLGDVTQSNVFTVDLDNSQVATFQEAFWLTYNQEVETLQLKKGGELVIRQQPGDSPTTETVTLFRAVDVDEKFIDWVTSTAQDRQLDTDHQPVTITMLDQANQPVARFNLANAWASEWNGPSPSATDSTSAVESVTITYDELTTED